MVKIGTVKSYQETRRDLLDRKGVSYFRGEWLQTTKDEIFSPTVFLIGLSPGMVLDTHFHRQDQFQFFTEGKGSLGPHVLEPGSVHYVNGYTGYGPMIAGPEGLSYLTIRCINESGALYIPDDMDKMVRRPKCQKVGITELRRDLNSEDDSGFETVFSSENSSMSAKVFNLGPSSSIMGPDPAGHGQYCIVLDGSLNHEGQELKNWEHVFVGGDDAEAYTINSGKEGLRVLVLQFPEPWYPDKPV